MIDQEIRSKGVGGSEVAAICGMDERRDAFAVYADKLGLVERPEPTKRMRWGKLLERAIIDGYGEETGLTTCWADKTMANSERHWQVYTPDAFVWNENDTSFSEASRIGGVDAKNVSFDQMSKWGERGTDIVPDSIALQCQWYCSAADLPFWDVAALFGGNDLRIYRIYRDPEVEAIILDAAESFWTNHVIARVPPIIGCSQTAKDYLKQRFPTSTQDMRHADFAELELLARLKQAKEDFDDAETVKETLENEVKLRIGETDGLLLPGKGKVTWLKNKDTMGTDWETLGKLYLAQYPDHQERILAEHQIVTRHGPRVLRCSWPKDDSWFAQPELPKEIEEGLNCMSVK